MRAVRSALLLILAAILLCACPARTVREKPPENPQQAAEHAVNEAQVAIAAGYITITKARQAKTITQDEFEALRDEIDKADAAYRVAFSALNASDFLKATNKAALAQSLLRVVTTQLAAIRSKP